MWILLLLSAWLILSIPLALLIGSFIASGKLDDAETASSRNPEQREEESTVPDRAYPERPAA